MNRDLNEKIYKKTGNTTRLEVLPTGMSIGTVKLNFQSFDSETLKQTALIPVYMSLTKAHSIGFNILLGNGESIKKMVGGTKEKQVIDENGNNVTIPCQYREMQIFRGQKKPWCISVKACEGEVGGRTGGIMPKKGLQKSDWTQIIIAFEDDAEFEEFGSALVMIAQTTSNSLYGDFCSK